MSKFNDKNLNKTKTDLNEQELDENLAKSSPVARLIKEQIDDEPSLTWRSALNEKLIAEAALRAPKKTSFFKSWKFGFSSSLVVGCLALLLVAPKMKPVSPTNSANQGNESLLLTAHSQVDFSMSLGTADGAEPINEASEDKSVSEWTEGDFTTL